MFAVFTEYNGKELVVQGTVILQEDDNNPDKVSIGLLTPETFDKDWLNDNVYNITNEPRLSDKGIPVDFDKTLKAHWKGLEYLGNAYGRVLIMEDEEYYDMFESSPDEEDKEDE
jgi:hypothetical protein